jgi:hypothetical protein
MRTGPTATLARRRAVRQDVRISPVPCKESGLFALSTEPLSEDELVELLEAQACRGHVRSIELLLARAREAPRVAPEDDPFAEVDELAEQQRQRMR